MGSGRPTAEVGRRLAAYLDRVVGGAGPLPARRFARDVVRGVLGAQSVRLSRIGEALGEDILPDSMERRLSRNLGAAKLDYGRVQHQYLRHAADRLDDDAVVAVDSSDIMKPYAKAMEGLGTVYDGSKRNEHANGYWMLGMTAVTGEGRHVPLHLEAYSLGMDEGISQAIVLRQALADVVPYVPAGALWVFDRGYDGTGTVELLSEVFIRWAIRQRGDRYLVYRGKQVICRKLADRVPTPHRAKLTIDKQGVGKKPRKVLLEYGAAPVRLPDNPTPLWLVVVWGFGKNPVMLLTNVPCGDAKNLRRVVLSYGKRWAAEEAFRFVKCVTDGFHIEDVRVLRYEPLRRLVFFAFLAAGFVADLERTPMLVKLLVAAVWLLKKCREVTRFLFYQLARAVAATLALAQRPRGHPR